jgi:hypothetical protein
VKLLSREAIEARASAKLATGRFPAGLLDHVGEQASASAGPWAAQHWVGPNVQERLRLSFFFSEAVFNEFYEV